MRRWIALAGAGAAAMAVAVFYFLPEPTVLKCDFVTSESTFELTQWRHRARDITSSKIHIGSLRVTDGTYEIEWETGFARSTTIDRISGQATSTMIFDVLPPVTGTCKPVVGPGS